MTSISSSCRRSLAVRRADFSAVGGLSPIYFGLDGKWLIVAEERDVYEAEDMGYESDTQSLNGGDGPGRRHGIPMTVYGLQTEAARATHWHTLNCPTLENTFH